MVGGGAVIVLSFFALLSNVLAHECYVCTEQDGNSGKCTTTVALCQYEEESCMTTVGWGSQPGWRIGVPMVHFVTKRCATDAECERRRRADEPLCTRNVYEDWRCTSCCKGDRCNYYVIDGAAERRAGLLCVALAGLALLLPAAGLPGR